MLVSRNHPWQTYFFSDGVGVMSSHLAKYVTRKLRLPRVPSAFQMRFGGAKGTLHVLIHGLWKPLKRWCPQEANREVVIVRCIMSLGMLSVWDEYLPPEKEVALRQTMVKFPSVHKTLEIVG